MIDLLKKTMLAGVGAAVVTKESAQKALDELVEKGKISSQEAQEMAGKIVDQGREEFEKTRGEFAKLFDEALAKANLANRKDLEALEARVAALEGTKEKADA
ncbi:hypothetical protein [Rubellicoccus peritrichatus]|uniref:Polyhydroxyalkanoate synthesis regulator phasin n=1 Tax=Rubellicoccus peritrichatus TaxID=3080537 RepID=A0AAQ3L708_9BACT|nr:hypothetical protein [Puniceicoccus sp. CR14]WOO40176.1 hypothetical protein RZN69_16260 [Puniceicoccus sp. CR14]